MTILHLYSYSNTRIPTDKPLLPPLTPLTPTNDMLQADFMTLPENDNPRQ